MKNIRIYASLVFLLMLNITYAQQAKIQGVITDVDSEETLIGANVVVGEVGVATDLNGSYTLNLLPGEHTLIFSFIGYLDEEMTINLSDGDVLTIDKELRISNTLLETATITSSKYEQRLAESTVSMDVVSSKLIESINAISPEQVLDKLPGVQILDDQANIRGGSGWSFGAGSRVMLLIDDIPALQADAGLAQWGDIPTENIAQIEVVKGAASALYGSSALNGIVNIRTGYATAEPETKVSIFGNAYLSPKDPDKKWWTGTPYDGGMSILHKQKFGKLDVVVGGFYFNRDSTNTYAENTFSNRKRFDLNLKYRATDRLTFALNTFVNDGSSSSFFLWGNGTAKAYRPFQGTVSTSDNFRYVVDPSITYFDKSNNRHRLQGRFYNIDNQNNMDQSNKSQLSYGEYQFQRKFDNQDLTLTTGTVATRVKSDSDLFSDTLITSLNAALYLQLDKKIFDKLNFSLGLRYEFNRQNTPVEFRGITVPGGKLQEGKVISRFGANYELADYTFIRGSWGQGYRFPTITERFIFTQFGGFTIFPNASLRSETGWSSELGVKQGFSLFAFEGFLDFSLFWSEYQDMTEFTFYLDDGAFGFQSQNIGNTQIKGFEISVAGRSKLFSVPVRLFGGYTYIDPIYKEFTESIEMSSSVDYNVLKYRFKHQFTFDVEGEWKGFSIGFALTAASHRLAIDQILETFVADLGGYRSLNNKGYKKFDTRVAYRFSKFKFSLLLNNAFNAEYADRPALLEAPRNIGFRMDYKI